MRLADHEARARLESHDHGILCTVHAERGVDAVPVAYAVDKDGYVGLPIDRVKPKASLRLQRERNLEADPRPHCSSSTGTAVTGHGCGGCEPSCAGGALPAVPRPALRPGTGAAHSRRRRLGRRRPSGPALTRVRSPAARCRSAALVASGRGASGWCRRIATQGPGQPLQIGDRHGQSRVTASSNRRGHLRGKVNADAGVVVRTEAQSVIDT